MQGFAFTVHTIRKAGQAGAIEGVWVESDPERAERAARRHARQRSGDIGVEEAVVQKFIVGQIGSRLLVAWYRDGTEHTLAERPAPPLPKLGPLQESDADDPSLGGAIIGFG